MKDRCDVCETELIYLAETGKAVCPKHCTPKKMDPKSAEWARLANSEARKHCPAIRPCADCGAPFVRGYRCNFCGSNDPEGPCTCDSCVEKRQERLQ